MRRRGRRGRAQLAADGIGHERGDAGSVVPHGVHGALELSKQAGARQAPHRVTQLRERRIHLSAGRVEDAAQRQRLLVGGTQREEVVELSAGRPRVVRPKTNPGQRQPGCRVVADADCLLEHRHGVGDTTLLCQQPRQRVHDRRILADCRDPSSCRLDAGVDTARAGRAPDEQRPGVGVLGSGRDRRLGVDQSAVVAAQAKPDVAPEPARVSALRVRGNGAVEGGVGRREEPGPDHQVGEADPAPRVLGVHLGEGLELEEGQVPVAEAQLGDRELATWVGRVRLQPAAQRGGPASPRRARAQPGATARAERGALRGARRRSGSGRSTATRSPRRR